ncbi:MAG: hypothetical protein ACO3F9_12785 [Burkholderiales bacterium]
MTADDLPWLALVAGISLIAWACRLLAADARGGFEVTMGGAMLYSHVWTLGAAACAWGFTALLAQPWWAGLLLFVALFLVKSAAYRIIVALFLGTKMPETPKQGGYSAFSESAKEIEENRKNGS